MLRTIAAGTTMLLATACLPASKAKEIVVDGQGVVMAEPDMFILNAEVVGVATTKDAALMSAADALERIKTQIPLLEGLTAYSVSAERSSVKPVYELQCARDAQYIQRESCLVEGWQVSIDIKVAGQPADKAGNALSFVGELGAREASVFSYRISELEKVRQQAAAAAIADAREKASRLAVASGGDVGAPTHIAYGASARDYLGEEDRKSLPSVMQVRSPGDSATPQVELLLAPEPIEIRESVMAVFELRGAAPEAKP